MPTALPPSSDFTGALVTKGSFKSAVTAMRDFLSGLVGADGAPATGLATLGAPLSSYVAKTGAYTLVAGDKGKVFSCTGTWSMAGLAAATAGDGFTVAVRNDGSGVITFDPNLTETIDGGATLAINAGESLILYCNGTLWISVGKSSGVPSGAGMDFHGATLPSGFLWADGSAVSRTTYASLFAAIGTTHGVGDGSTTFNVPDKRGRVSAGKDNMGGSAASRLTTAGSGVDGATLGAAGGAETHTLTTAQLANHTHSHSHTVQRVQSSAGSNDIGPVGGSGSDYALTSGSAVTSTDATAAGSGNAHNNTQPTLVCNYIIKT